MAFRGSILAVVCGALPLFPYFLSFKEKSMLIFIFINYYKNLFALKLNDNLKTHLSRKKYTNKQQLSSLNINWSLLISFSRDLFMVPWDFFYGFVKRVAVSARMTSAIAFARMTSQMPLRVTSANAFAGMTSARALARMPVISSWDLFFFMKSVFAIPIFLHEVYLVPSKRCMIPQ